MSDTKDTLVAALVAIQHIRRLAEDYCHLDITDQIKYDKNGALVAILTEAQDIEPVIAHAIQEAIRAEYAAQVQP